MYILYFNVYLINGLGERNFSGFFFNSIFCYDDLKQISVHL